MVGYITLTRRMLHIKELGPKGPRYLIVQHFSRPRYVMHHNSQKSDKYLLILALFKLEPQT